MSFSNKYEQIRLLGEGTYGKAFLVRCIGDKVSKILFYFLFPYSH